MTPGSGFAAVWAMIGGSLNLWLFSRLDAGQAAPAAISALAVVAQGPVWILPPLVLAVWLVGSKHDREAAVSAAVAACLAMALAHAASALVDHPRPFMIALAPNRFDHAADSSFPSDHATLFFALAASFRLRPVAAGHALPVVLALGGLAVGLSRVALGVHFPFDVAGAAAIGGAAAFATTTVLDRPVSRLADLCETLWAAATRLWRRPRSQSAESGTDAHSAH